MLVKKVKYEDFDGNEREETLYFNLTRTELIEMELSENGGFDKFLRRIIEERDNQRLAKLFKQIILASYGVKSADGKRFFKSKELSEEFSQTGAYDALFLELISDTNNITAFINGIIPEKVAEDAKKYLDEHPEELPSIPGV